MAVTGTQSTAAAPDPHRLGAKLKSALVPGQPALGGNVSEYLRPSVVNFYGQAGFDFIFLESEHVLFEPTRLSDFILCARSQDMPVIAKVPDLQRPWVCFLLDAGVTGIQLPRTESRQDLLQLRDWMRFPPTGSRAGAPGYGNTDYASPEDHRVWMQGADANALLVAHIETQRGYENFAEIVSAPDLGMVYVGPYDFSISLGHPGEFNHPLMRECMLEMLQMCRAHDIPFGTTPPDAESAAFWAKQGASFFEACDELTFVQSGALQLVESWRRQMA